MIRTFMAFAVLIFIAGCDDSVKPSAKTSLSADGIPGEPADSAATKTLRQARSLRAHQQRDSAVLQFRLAEQLATSAKYVPVIAESQEQLAALYYEMGESDSVEIYKKKLITGIDSLRDGRPKMMMLGSLSVIYATHNEPQKALTGFFQKLQYDREARDSVKIGVGLMQIGRTYMQLNENRHALDYLLQSLPFLRGPAKVTCLSLVGTRFASEINYDSAAYFHLDAIRTASTITDSSNLYNAYLSYSESLVSLGKFAQARNYLAQALQYFERVQYIPSIIDIHTIQASIAESEHRYDVAAQELLAGLAYATEGEFTDWREFIYKELARIYSAKGDYPQAFIYQQRYTALTDSTKAATNQHAIVELETKYKTSVKESQIEKLELQAAASAQLLQAQHRNQWLLAAALLLALIAAALFYRNSRFRRKTAVLLNQRNAALETANASKIKLFSIISHDLRAPVSSLFNLLEIEGQKEKEETWRLGSDRRAQLQESATQVLESMEDILLWSKTQLESFKPGYETVGLNDLVNEAMEINQVMAGQRGVLLTTSIDDAQISTDVNLLKTVLRNLTSNAIRFSPPGSAVTIRATHDQAQTCISVTDNGPGMTTQEISGLLEWNSVRSSASGYGLGLARELVEKMGGRLEISSSPGQGTLVRVTLPAEPPNQGPLHALAD